MVKARPFGPRLFMLLISDSFRAVEGSVLKNRLIDFEPRKKVPSVSLRSHCYRSLVKKGGIEWKHYATPQTARKSGTLFS